MIWKTEWFKTKNRIIYHTLKMCCFSGFQTVCRSGCLILNQLMQGEIHSNVTLNIGCILKYLTHPEVTVRPTNRRIFAFRGSAKFLEDGTS